MPTDTVEPRAPRLERAIVLQMLREDRGPRWPREALLRRLAADRGESEGAIGALVSAGVLCLGGDELWASEATWRLSALGLIAV